MSQFLNQVNGAGPKKILSLDGGGVRGALTLGYLEKVESLLRQRFNNETLVLSDYYDLIGGTSTGAIIAACLAIGQPVKDIVALYTELGAVVFGQRRYPIIPRSWKMLRSLFKSSYKSEVFEALLRKTLDVGICDYEKIKCGLAIISKRADTYSLWTVANHPDGIYTHAMDDLRLWELCRASAAAPYYFSPKKLQLKTREGAKFEAAFIDGGVSLANNPAFQLFLTATIPSFGFKWQPGADNIFITSFGTGNGISRDNVETLIKSRTINWASKIPELFMTDALEFNEVILQMVGKNCGDGEIIDSQYLDLKEVDYSAQKLLSFIRFNVILTKDYLKTHLGIEKTDAQVASLVEMDHYENIEELLRIGRKAAEKIDQRHVL